MKYPASSAFDNSFISFSHLARRELSLGSRFTLRPDFSFEGDGDRVLESTDARPRIRIAVHLFFGSGVEDRDDDEVDIFLRLIFLLLSTLESRDDWWLRRSLTCFFAGFLALDGR